MKHQDVKSGSARYAGDLILSEAKDLS